MNRLPMPGCYVSSDGSLHIDIAELLTAAGYPDTPENRAILLKEFRTLSPCVIHDTDDPIPDDEP